ncbi:hypothetical protein B9Z19DRAFT_1067405 [Tuber borchii]|uniref:Uncharacterized protein n=1 Tax=Tuber borchii TaxID=42251 RepID=A0A2T6ZIZ5_TUBBO|nr:hypothetical protein B9Z19DRAFT_1067405 [Tuber borchii]
MAEESSAQSEAHLEPVNLGSLCFPHIYRELVSEILAILLPDSGPHPSRCRLHYHAREGYLRIVGPEEFSLYPVSWMCKDNEMWWYDGLLDQDDRIKIFQCSPAWDKFIGQHADSNKKPSLFLMPVIEGEIRDIPSVIFESGWGESGPLSISDSLVWLEGTGGAVKVVIFLKTFTPDKENKIKATLTVCRNNPCGTIVKTEQNIFPAPDQILPDPYITINELYGGRTPASLGSDTQLPLSMEKLREFLGLLIRQKGHLPA